MLPRGRGVGYTLSAYFEPFPGYEVEADESPNEAILRPDKLIIGKTLTLAGASSERRHGITELLKEGG